MRMKLGKNVGNRKKLLKNIKKLDLKKELFQILEEVIIYG